MTRPEPIDVHAPDGTLLRGLQWASEADWALLLHDAREDLDLEAWFGLIPHLLGQDLSVLAVDLRGHGGSEGAWNPALAVDDVAAMIRFARDGGARSIVVIADGAAAIAAARAAEQTPVDGLVLVSPRLGEDKPAPRGAGEAKLLIAGVRDPAAKAALDRLRAASIGWALAVNLPTTEQGGALLDGEWAANARDHLFAFLRERRLLSGGSGRGGMGAPPRNYLDHIGIGAHGVNGMNGGPDLAGAPGDREREDA